MDHTNNEIDNQLENAFCRNRTLVRSMVATLIILLFCFGFSLMEFVEIGTNSSLAKMFVFLIAASYLVFVIERMIANCPRRMHDERLRDIATNKA